MEAQLIDPEFGLAPRLTFESDAADATARRVDRYLQAAGVAEPCRRKLLAETVIRALHASAGEATAWPKIIAAADAALLAELPAATPQRGHRPMQPQNLSPWRPQVGLPLPARLSRVALGWAACLGWLAIVFIP